MMRSKPDFRAAALAGIIAGTVFLVLELALVAIALGQSPWAPPRMMAAIVMGEGVLPPPATFDFGIVAMAMLVHFGLSIVLGLAFAVGHALLDMSRATALVAGTIFGLLVYYVDFYLFTEVFPWFAMARGAVSIIAHAAFGLALGWAYHAIARPQGRLV